MTSTNPTVSIIIPTYNSSVTLAWAIRSVLNQEYTDYEVWIVGDGCTDDSEAVVASFSDPRLNWVNLPENSGSQSKPNNEAVRRARGRYIAHLGHDDLWLPEHLKLMVARIEETNADFVHAFIAMYGPDGLRGVIGVPPRGRTYANSTAAPSSWLYRRGVPAACGEWVRPTSIGLPIDMDYLRRIYEGGHTIDMMSHVTVLKFPSRWWGLYRLTEGWPQGSRCELIEDDPEQLRREIAHHITTRLAQHWRAIPRFRDVLRLGYEWTRDALLAPKRGVLRPVQWITYQFLWRDARRRRGLKVFR